jgi:hypothetical protein
MTTSVRANPRPCRSFWCNIVIDSPIKSDGETVLSSLSDGQYNNKGDFHFPLSFCFVFNLISRSGTYRDSGIYWVPPCFLSKLRQCDAV